MESKQGKSKNRHPARKLNRHPKYELMTFRLADRFGIAGGAQCFAELPEDVRALYSHYTYLEIIRPLVCLDKKENPALSFEALANRYGISKNGVYKMILAWVGRDVIDSFP